MGESLKLGKLFSSAAEINRFLQCVPSEEPVVLLCRLPGTRMGRENVGVGLKVRGPNGDLGRKNKKASETHVSSFASLHTPW